jgi:hypothetical protein
MQNLEDWPLRLKKYWLSRKSKQLKVDQILHMILLNNFAWKENNLEKSKKKKIKSKN